MDTQEVVEKEKPVRGPGSLLTEARLKLGMEPQNVAEILHLRGQQIQALEADDYENLPEPTYVKGYLRAYCQLLSLDSDIIVEMYSSFITPPVKESFEALMSERQAASNDNLVKLVSLGLVGLIAGLAITFWLNSGVQTDQIENVSRFNAAATQPSVPSTGSNEVNADGSSVAKAGSSAATATSLAQEQPRSAEIVTEKLSTAGQAAPKPESTISSNPAIDQPAADSSAGIRDELSLLPETDAFAHSRLLVKVTESSWIDVRDARDNKLIYENVPAGREIPLEGLAPFKIFLGNAVGVRVFLEGKEIDVKKHKRGLTARFGLAKPGGTQ